MVPLRMFLLFSELCQGPLWVTNEISFTQPMLNTHFNANSICQSLEAFLQVMIWYLLLLTLATNVSIPALKVTLARKLSLDKWQPLISDKGISLFDYKVIFFYQDIYISILLMNRITSRFVTSRCYDITLYFC